MLYYLLLGGNLGNVDEAMRRAVRRFEKEGRVTAISHVVKSPAWGFESADDFHNVVIAFDSTLGPIEVLHLAQETETELGRQPKSNPDVYESRPIDIDILFADDSIISCPELTVPHPRLQLRRFTLVPLAELAPGLAHPLLGKTVAQLLSECQDAADVAVLGELFPCFEQ